MNRFNIGCQWDFCLKGCITQPHGASKLHGQRYSLATPVFSEFRVEISWEALWQLQKWQ
jgi:hypothetical protein